MATNRSKSKYKLVENFFKKKFEIPETWEYVLFSSVVQVNPITKVDSKKASYVPMDAVNTNNPHVDYFEERKVEDNTNLPAFQENDVLFARITPSTENGKTAIMEKFTGKGIASTELTVLRSSSKIIPYFLYYYVKSHPVRQFAISQMIGTTNRQRVPDYVFKKDLFIALPKLNEQKKIVSILSNVDNTIQNTNQIKEQTQLLKKGLMHKLLTKGIGHTKFKKVKSIFREYIQIPEVWDFVTLKELVPKNQKGTIRMGPFGSNLKKHELKDHGDVKTLWIENIVKNNFSWEYRKYITKEKYQELKGFSVKPDDVLITMMGTVGKVAIVPKNIGTAIISSHLLKITLNQKKCLPIFLYYYLLSYSVYRQIIRESRGTIMSGLNTDVIKSLLIEIPPIPEQQKIATILLNIDAEIQKQKLHKSNLELLKKGLMQKLFTGKIRVKF